MANDIIKTNNTFTVRKYDLNLLQQNTMYCIIRQIQDNYNGIKRDASGHYPELHVYIDDDVFAQIAGKKHREDAREALKKLKKFDVSLDFANGSWVETSFISSAEFDAEKGVYDVAVSGSILPYYLEVVKNYTAYSLSVVISLKSVYSQRFYELCKRWADTGFFLYDADKLREMLSCSGTYTKLPDFERDVIRRAEKELKKKYEEGECDVWFEWKKLGFGKKARYNFFVHTSALNKKRKENWKEVMSLAQRVRKGLTWAFPNDTPYVEYVMHYLDMRPDVVKIMLKKINNTFTKFEGNKSSIAKYLRVVFENEYAIPKSIKTPEREKKRKAAMEHQEQRYAESGDKNTAAIGDVLKNGSPRANDEQIYRNHYK